MAIIIGSVLLLSLAIRNNWHPVSGPGNGAPPQGIRKLPADFEAVVEGYRYSETGQDLQVTISGNRIIRRGRKILGLRSNLVKTNFLEDVRGRIGTHNGTVEFAASDAEWEADAGRPFFLKKNVTISIDGKLLPHLKNARIYFKQRLLVTTAGREESYHHF